MELSQESGLLGGTEMDSRAGGRKRAMAPNVMEPSNRERSSEINVSPAKPITGRGLAKILDDLVALPARCSRAARFVIVTMLDGATVLFSLFLTMLLVQGPIPHLLWEFPATIILFVGVVIAGLSFGGLNWRSWRCMSFKDCLTLCGALSIGLVAAWSAVLLFVPSLRSEWASLAAFAAVHAGVVLLAMMGLRGVRRLVSDYARTRGTADEIPTPQNILLLGSLEWIKSMAELVRADRHCRARVVGALSFDRRAAGLQVGGVPVLGSPANLPEVTSTLEKAGSRPATIVVADEDMQRSEFTQLLRLAGQCDVGISRGHSPHRPKGQSRDFSLSDLMDRPEMTLDRAVIERLVRRRRILVTGAGGTIGSELVQQLATFGPAELVLLDHSEFNLYSIDMYLREHAPEVARRGELCCVRDRDAVNRIFKTHQPDIVFHAAALKHVPMVEGNPCAGVHTNVLGTRNVAEAVCDSGALAMIQISTDKAVNPIGMMGATKRLGELYCQALDLIGQCDHESPRFMTVRFGNVLGSSGSLVPLFERQLADGKPLTVTHPDMTRYFMTVGEAVQLILQSTARALETNVHRGTIFVLDMGDPLRILDIARRMIVLAGLRPEKDVAIEFVGLRPGEKLSEELFDSSEVRMRSTIPGIIEAKPSPIPLETLVAGFSALEELIDAGDDEGIRIKVGELLLKSSHSVWSDTLRDLGIDDESIGGDADFDDQDVSGSTQPLFWPRAVQ